MKGEDGKYVLDHSDDGLHPDLVLMCAGNGSPNTAFLKPFFDNLVDEQGFIKVCSIRAYHLQASCILACMNIAWDD